MKSLTKTTARMLGLSAALALLPLARANDADKDFAMMDANNDGQVTRAEHAAAAKKMFAEMDANHDGIVTAAEMDAMHAAKSHGGKPADMQQMSSAEKIKVIDTDGDGKLTAAEHEAGSAKMFDKMDTNHDGVLSKEECAAGHKKLMNKNAS